MIKAKVGKKPNIQIPDEVYDSLGLAEGQKVEIAIVATNQTDELSKDEILTKLEKTQGIWADNPKIVEAFDYLEKKCQSY